MDALLEPIAPDAPAGANIRETPGLQEHYYRLKDARSAARLAERSLDPDEGMRVPAEWKEVDALAREALTAHTKDIEILCWLIEASLRLRGLPGLGEAFRLAAALVERDFEALHSFDAEPVTDKVEPFAGLNGTGSEGVLIQPLRFAPLVPGEPFYEAGLWTYQLAARDGGDANDALRGAAAAAGAEAMRAHLAAATEAGAAFDALSRALDERCGPDAPPASNVRNMLGDIASAIRDIGGVADGAVAVDGAADEDDEAETVTAPTAPSDAPPEKPSAGPRPLQTREDAFARLLEVADFFRRTEPHSPLSFAIETLVRRGRMPFPELLEELMPDNQARQLFLTAAGIRPQSDAD